MDFKKLLDKPEYKFIKTDKHLGKHVMLLGLGGSHAYGTNNENSDIDLRGVTLNLPSELLGLSKFEQYEDKKTDTVIYSFNKIVQLLLNCNPNTIEILGLDEDQYLIKSDLGQELIDNAEMFLSKRAIRSFGGYADAQLRRLQNAIARDSMSQSERESHIFRSVKNALDDFNRTFGIFDKGKMKLYIDKAETEGLEEEIFIDADYTHMPLREYNQMLSVMNSVVREYDRVGKRNKKKDCDHLNKHAMHLIRLFMMAIDILEKKRICTHRTGEDLKTLKDIRMGKYMTDNHTFSEEFYEILSDYEKKLDEAAKVTKLPDNPDMAVIERFVEKINYNAIV